MEGIKCGKVWREISQIDMLKYYPLKIEHETGMNLPASSSDVESLP